MSRRNLGWLAMGVAVATAVAAAAVVRRAFTSDRYLDELLRDLPALATGEKETVEDEAAPTAAQARQVAV